MTTWQDRLSGKPHIFGLDYLYQFPDPEQASKEATWAKFPLLITGGVITAEGTAHYHAMGTDQVRLAYLAANHSSADYLAVGKVQADLKDSGLFMRFADGSIPVADGAQLYDYRTAGWRTQFLEAVREIACAGFDGVFIDNCNVWNAACEGNSQLVRRELLEALQDALQTVRARYPSLCLVGNSDVRLACLNGELAENDPHRFSAVCKPYPGHVAPELNLCLLYSALEVNCHNAFKAVTAAGGWFGAQVDTFTPQWWDWYTQ